MYLLLPQRTCIRKGEKLTLGVCGAFDAHRRKALILPELLFMATFA